MLGRWKVQHGLGELASAGKCTRLLPDAPSDEESSKVQRPCATAAWPHRLNAWPTDLGCVRGTNPLSFPLEKRLYAASLHERPGDGRCWLVIQSLGALFTSLIQSVLSAALSRRMIMLNVPILCGMKQPHVKCVQQTCEAGQVRLGKSRVLTGSCLPW